jgi:hypothetical protein
MQAFLYPKSSLHYVTSTSYCISLLLKHAALLSDVSPPDRSSLLLNSRLAKMQDFLKPAFYNAIQASKGDHVQSACQ